MRGTLTFIIGISEAEQPFHIWNVNIRVIEEKYKQISPKKADKIRKGKYGKTIGGNLGASLGKGVIGTLFKDESVHSTYKENQRMIGKNKYD